MWSVRGRRRAPCHPVGRRTGQVRAPPPLVPSPNLPPRASSPLVPLFYSYYPSLTIMDPSAPVNNLRSAYAELLRRVNVALRTQVGDAPRLRAVRAQALALRAAAEEVRVTLRPLVAPFLPRTLLICESAPCRFPPRRLLHSYPQCRAYGLRTRSSLSSVRRPPRRGLSPRPSFRQDGPAGQALETHRSHVPSVCIGDAGVHRRRPPARMFCLSRAPPGSEVWSS